MRGAKMTLLHLPDGSMRLRYRDRDLQYTKVKSSPRPSPAEDEETIDAHLDAVLTVRRDDSPTAKPARARKETYLLCAIRGHFYRALTGETRSSSVR